MTPLDISINEDPQDPQRLLRRKLTLFGFLVTVYDRLDYGDNISKERFGLGSPCFHATMHLKIEG